MKKLLYGTVLISALAFFSFKGFEEITYQVKDDFAVKFTNAKVSGSFSSLKGNILFDSVNPERSAFSMTVDIASIKTGNFIKNSHAKGSDWFDADHYPNIRFTSASFVKKGSDYEVSGTLEMHGIKKAVTIPFRFNGDTFSGHFSLNRLDYKVGTMEGMSARVPADIEVELSVPVKKL